MHCFRRDMPAIRFVPPFSLQLAIVLGMVLAIPAASDDARACSITHSVRFAVPEDGAINIPTDVRPWVEGTVLWDEGAQFILEGPEGPVGITLRRHRPVDSNRPHPGVDDLFHSVVEIIPDATLTPHTSYALIVQSSSFVDPQIWISEFTTGAGPTERAIPAGLDAAKLSFAETTYRQHFNCPTYPNAMCLSVPQDAQFEARFVDVDSGNTTWTTLGRGPLALGRISGASTHPVCVALHPRDYAGNLGEPTTLCSDDAEVSQHRGPIDSHCTSIGLEVEERAIPANETASADEEDAAGATGTGDSSADAGQSAANQRSTAPAEGDSDSEMGCSTTGTRGRGAWSVGLLLASFAWCRSRRARPRARRGIASRGHP